MAARRVDATWVNQTLGTRDGEGGGAADTAIYFTRQRTQSMLAIACRSGYPIQIRVARSIGLANGVLRQLVDVFQGSNLATIPGLSRNVKFRQATLD